jgi:MscS family membrane protein
MMEILKQTDLWIANWKWVLIFATILLSALLASLIRRLLGHLVLLISKRTQNNLLLDTFNLKIESIISWIIVSGVWTTVIDILDLHVKVEKYVTIAVEVVQAYLLIRLAYKFADAIGNFIQRAADKTETTLDNQLVPLARKTLKLIVVIVGTLIILQGFGFHVVSLLAGLGLGGLALALAAQDTAANVFGSITIFLDQPFQIGHVIKVGDTEGTVEEIGFRSTRLRTAYNSVVTVPNSTMAKEKIDNMGVRKMLRTRWVLGITYDTSPERLSGFIDTVQYMLHQHPKVLKDDIRVYFNNLGDFSLQILVQFFIAPVSHPREELTVQQEILLEIMKLATKLDVSFAFPTQTIQLEQPSQLK